MSAGRHAKHPDPYGHAFARPHPARRTQAHAASGCIPRIARFRALAHHFQELLDTGAVETQAKIAEAKIAEAKLTPARVTQIMNLLGLAPDLQEEIFFLPPVIEGAASDRGTTPAANAEDGRVE